MSAAILQLHPDDNIVVALRDLPKGSSLQIGEKRLQLLEHIPIKHKFALHDFDPGEAVFMYGLLIGKATQPIRQGALISVDNVEHSTGIYQGRTKELNWQAPDVAKWKDGVFWGYHRPDGSVGTANYWLVIPLVFCENRNIIVLREALQDALGYGMNKEFEVDTHALIRQYLEGEDEASLQKTKIVRTAQEIQKNRVFPNVDGIKFLTHEGGCGGTREDSENLCRLLAGYIANPNVAGATILSLGCQHAQDSILLQMLQKQHPACCKPLYILTQQDSLSERDFIEEAVKKTFFGLMKANKIVRKPAPLSKLVVGLECGGSDGFSGISANPAVGYASDLLVALGGTTILSEFPELHGVEQELINRCVTDELAQKFVGLMDAYSERAEAVGSGFKNNPSPGNIEDGLITDAMKSAGAARKGGTSPITDVLDYTEKARKPGLALLCTPGNDVESTTGLAASGATIILFTTGLGTPTGNPVAPVIKVSTNNRLHQKMADIIDVNAGTIITGEDTIESKGMELLEYIIQVASGKATPHAVRLGQDDFIPWKRGVSL